MRSVPRSWSTWRTSRGWSPAGCIPATTTPSRTRTSSRLQPTRPCAVPAADLSFAARNSRSSSIAVVDNARVLADALMAAGVPVVTGGTDNHLVLVDVRHFGLNGRQAESACRAAGITLNRNVVPDDTNGPWYTSGLRLGTPAVTTLGMRGDEMREIAEVLAAVLQGASAGVITSGPNQGKPSLVQFRLDDMILRGARSRVNDLLLRHPLYPDIEL